MAVQSSDALAAAGADPTVPITSVRVLYSDLHGIARGKDVPVQEFDRIAEQGLAFCSAVMGTDLRHTPVVGGEEGYPDLHAHPDVSTLRALPWEPGVACCLSDLASAHPDVPVVDPRGALKAVTADLESLGLAPVVGPELEFFLLVPDPSAPGGVRRLVDRLSMVYTVGPQVDPGGTVRRMSECLAEVGLGTFAMNHEFMNSQYEINQLHCGAVEAADRAFRLKAHVKDMAAQAGLVATFMGKPFNDQGGSGFHLHLSLERDGANALGAPDAPDGVADELRHFVGGILAHAPATMALLNPTVNAYRRLVPDSLAPTQANWGWDNRSTFVRIPPERGPATRIEVRVGDGGANPYLATAALLAAGAHGLRERTEPPEPISGDAYRAEQSEATRLPHCLEDALDALDGDTVLREALGAPLVDMFLAMKRFEVERHRAWTSDWELEEYLHSL
ncbi:MAG: glutamine synthetase [Solirubrobacterales bacterium]|nr:glutamine synthetase [Solirubrobacterales bacterium]